VLAQDVPVRIPVGRVRPARVRFDASGWFGASARSKDRASLRPVFLGADGAALGHAVVGPLTDGDRHGRTELLRRAASGTVPPGTRSIRSSWCSPPGPPPTTAGRRRSAASTGRRPTTSRSTFRSPCAGLRRCALPAPTCRASITSSSTTWRTRTTATSSATGNARRSSTACCRGRACSRTPTPRSIRATPTTSRSPRAARSAAAHGPAGGGSDLRDRRAEHRGPPRRRARDVEGLPPERQRPVRRHRARHVLGRRSPATGPRVRTSR
jgi:hypothetical protein